MGMHSNSSFLRWCRIVAVWPQELVARLLPEGLPRGVRIGRQSRRRMVPRSRSRARL